MDPPYRSVTSISPIPQFAVTSARPVPSLQRSERVKLELATSATETAVARLLDRTGKPLQVPVRVTERTDAAGGIRWIVADATLAPLAPGDYAIEVAAGNTKQVTGFRIVP